jgi:hypothetical protein
MDSTSVLYCGVAENDPYLRLVSGVDSVLLFYGLKINKDFFEVVNIPSFKPKRVEVEKITSAAV